MNTSSRRNEQVDISVKPIPDPSKKENLGITIGDLHANAIKLLFFLIKEGVVETTSEHYGMLVDIYNQSGPSHKKEVLAEQLVTLREIINELSIKNKKSFIRFIGDELADRGKNDLFILLLLAKLTKESINFEVLISNHSIEFIIAYEKKTRFQSARIGFFGQTLSMDNMQRYIDLGLIARTEVEEIVANVYLPKLKLISYSIDRDKSKIKIYSHAPIDLNIVKKIARRLTVNYKDNTIESLAQTIDTINSRFQLNYAVPGEIHELFHYLDNAWDPFNLLIWNRDCAQLKRPPQHNHYKIHYVHGHDSNAYSPPNVSNLDTPLGKPGRTIGLYDVVHSYEQNLAEIKKIDYRNDLETLLKKCAVLKAKSLDNHSYSHAYNEAFALYHQLKTNFDELEANNISYDLFKSNSLAAIKLAKPVLSQHRDWNYLLANIALGIAGLGIFYAVAGLVNLAVNGHFLFFSKTDSFKTLEKLENNINSIFL